MDIQLIEKALNKDKVAFKSLYEVYNSRVYRTAYIILDNTSMAEDILQEVFMNLYLKGTKLKHYEAFESWLYKMTVNSCMNYIKKSKKVSFIGDDEVLDAIDKIDFESTPEDMFIREELTSEIMKYIYELPANHRTTVILFYYNELPIKEIASIMDCSEGTVKSRLFYSKKFLKDKITEKEII